MSLYRCTADWEHSMYDDSDWHCVVYNDVTDRLERVMTGTTRFACGTSGNGGEIPMTDEMRPRAMAALVALYLDAFTRAEERNVNEPSIKLLLRGVKVRLSAAHKCQRKAKSVEAVTCEKCSGSGAWVNPRRSSDRRECFACKGTGKGQKVTRAKVTGENGKTEWERIEAGAVGTVQGQATFGTFYRNGYNQPDRNNTTVYVILDDGREIRCPAAKLRLDREMVDGAALLARATERAAGGGDAFYAPFATSGSSML